MKDKYLTYKVEELAAEEAFISWIKEGEKSSEWSKWLELHPDLSGMVAKAKDIVEGIQFVSHPISLDLKKEMWKNIDQATTDKAVTPKSRRLFMISSVAAAAAVLLILYSIFTMNDGLIISTDIGGQELVQLPDNSSVKLNAVSSVQYDTGKFLEERTINLKGEAFFEVEKGSRFIVETASGNVEVLGTSFNVYSRDDSLSVSCYTGKVKVSRAGNEVVLTPGENVEIGSARKSMEKETFTKEEDTPSWMNGMFSFKNEKLSVVFDELKRQYNINIEYEDPSISNQVTGVVFFNSGNLDEALKNIAFTEKIQYKKEGNTVVLSR